MGEMVWYPQPLGGGLERNIFSYPLGHFRCRGETVFMIVVILSMNSGLEISSIILQSSDSI